MWIYDGEEWTEQGVNQNEAKPHDVQRPEEMFYPEVQVVEITPVPVTNTNYLPPMPQTSRRTDH